MGACVRARRRISAADDRQGTHLPRQVHNGAWLTAGWRIAGESKGSPVRFGYRGRAVLEVVGDSSRGGDVALVRLSVEGDRIVSADAPGLDRPLDGLTLLQAARVGGETLAVDALAN